MAGVAPVTPKFQFSDSLGVPLVSGTVTVYLAGTTTPTNTWQDSSLSTLNTNPITLDSRGECVMWLDSSLTYKFLLKNAAGVTQYTADNISGASNSGAVVTFTPSGAGAVTRTVQDRLRDEVSVFDFMTAAQIADVRAGTVAVDVTSAIQAALDTALTISAPMAIQTKFRGLRLRFPRGRYRMTAGVTGRAGVSIIGDGYESTVFVHEGTSGHVFSFTGADNGNVDFLCLEGFSVAQKAGTTHTSGYAIKIEGNSFGTTPRIRDVYTYGTYEGLYMDWCFPSTIEGVHCFAHTGAGFTTGFDCTSTTFQNCYAGANTGHGFKIAGHYISCINCASDSNGGDGYHVYYATGAATGISLISCGTEQCSGSGIYSDRVGSLSIVSPRVIMKSTSTAAFTFNDGDAITVISPVPSATAANANACFNISNASGAYPSNVQIYGWSGTATNFASTINQPDYVFWVGSRTNFGAYGDTLRLGGIGSFTRASQTLFIGSNFPAGSGGTAYSQNFVPVVTAALTTLGASARYKPVVNAAAATIARLVSGPLVEAPTVTAGTVTRHEGARINDQPAGATADANLVLGDAAVPAGRFNQCNVSTRDNLFAGAVQWLTNAGPKDYAGTGTPEGAVTAAIGSTWRRTDGGAGTSFYVKESGSGNTGWVGK